MRRREDDGLWTTHLYGGVGRSLGPAHGLVGNVLALCRRLPAEQREQLERESAATLAARAVVEDGLANWANHAEVADLQWCSGAPGIVVSAADYLDEELLLAGAELVWQAGPHGDEKGYGICHGTAGNGYALLRTFERTGDEQWLERARRFAVHALEQAARLEGTRGRRRYSLWTGDVGAALYRGRLPGRARSLSDPRHMGVSGGELEFRPMVADDLRLLHDWLQRPHVRRWWGERRTYEDVVAHYLPRSTASTRPTTTLCCSTDGPSACSRRTSSQTIRSTRS